MSYQCCFGAIYHLLSCFTVFLCAVFSCIGIVSSAALLPFAQAEEVPLSEAKNLASLDRAASSLSIPGSPSSAEAGLVEGGDLKGWDFLVHLLGLHGIPAERSIRIFSDPRMPPREPVGFRVYPRESRALYRRLNTSKNRKHALEFFREHRRWFDQAEARYHVPSSVILSLIQVETACGKHTGRERVFYRLARLASVAEPSNIEQNIREEDRRGNEARPELVARRAQVLQSMFLPHLLDTIRLADQMGQDPLEMRGSSGGAIGIPQFLPGNVLRYGIDADRDGMINVFAPADSIVSIARFLSESAWPKNSRPDSKLHAVQRKMRAAILEYNRSDAYVDTVLTMAVALRGQMRSPQKTSVKASAIKSRSSKSVTKTAKLSVTRSEY